MSFTLNHPVFLVGLMGAGKTTLGKLAAEALSVPFVDTDEEIVTRAGADITWIFDVEGEQGFRARETSVLQDYVAESPMIVSTGGGIIQTPVNRELLNSATQVIYLDAEPEKLYARIGKDKRRPLLQTEDPLQRLKELHANRDPLYREVATDVLYAYNYPPKEMARRLIELIKNK